MVRGVCAFLLLLPCVADAATALYVNRCGNGCSFTPGLPDNAVTNVTPIVSAPSTLTAFAHGDAVFNATVACIAAAVAPYQLQVTTSDPSPLPHLEIVLAGSASQIGQPDSVAASARQQCAYLPNSISFVFANAQEPLAAELCSQALHNLGHHVGLEYLFYCPDAMSLLSGCGDKAFRDRDSACGLFQPRTCTCPVATHNSHRAMVSAFGLAPLFADGFE